MRRMSGLVVIAVVGVLALTGCGSSTPKASGTSSPMSSATPTTPFQRQTQSSTPKTAQDLPVTDALRAQLVAAGAKAKGLKASDFVGLVKGLTYYAFDPATDTYWAGAALRASSSSLPAQVSTQDDGAYDLFHRSSTGSWVAMDSAMAAPNGPVDGGPCALTPPADVLAVWGWPAKSCHPSNG